MNINPSLMFFQNKVIIIHKRCFMRNMMRAVVISLQTIQLEGLNYVELVS